MDYISGPVILSSQDKLRMTDFLSDVFEFDVDMESDCLSKGSLNVKLVDSPDFKHVSSGVTFAFKLKDADQMQEILDKFNFFLYRKAQDPNNEKFRFVEYCQENSLQFRDFDGRTWRFDLPAKDALNDF